MFTLISLFQAAGEVAAPAPSLIESLLPLLLIFVVFWFLIIRPQQKKMKEHRELVNNVRRGDTVVTSGGIVGKVSRVKDDDEQVEVEIAEGVKVRVVKSTLADVRAKGEPASSDKS